MNTPRDEATPKEPPKKQSSLQGFFPRGLTTPINNPTLAGPSLVRQDSRLHREEGNSVKIRPPASLPLPSSCPIAADPDEQHPVLHPIEKLLDKLPGPEPLEYDDDPLAAFEESMGEPMAVDTSLCGDDLWETVVSKILHRVFWGKAVGEIANVIRSNTRGARAYCHFARYWITKRGVKAAYFEAVTERIKEAIELM
jgi:hypothetical protein